MTKVENVTPAEMFLFAASHKIDLGTAVGAPGLLGLTGARLPRHALTALGRRPIGLVVTRSLMVRLPMRYVRYLVSYRALD
jgi:hypothetical protein